MIECFLNLLFLANLQSPPEPPQVYRVELDQLEESSLGPVFLVGFQLEEIPFGVDPWLKARISLRAQVVVPSRHFLPVAWEGNGLFLRRNRQGNWLWWGSPIDEDRWSGLRFASWALKIDCGEGRVFEFSSPSIKGGQDRQKFEKWWQKQEQRKVFPLFSLNDLGISNYPKTSDSLVFLWED